MEPSSLARRVLARYLAAVDYSKLPAEALKEIKALAEQVEAGAKKFDAERGKKNPDTVTEKEEHALSLLLNKEVYKHVQDIWKLLNKHYSTTKGSPIIVKDAPAAIQEFIKAKSWIDQSIKSDNTIGYDARALIKAAHDLAHSL